MMSVYSNGCPGIERINSVIEDKLATQKYIPCSDNDLLSRHVEELT